MERLLAVPDGSVSPPTTSDSVFILVLGVQGLKVTDIPQKDKALAHSSVTKEVERVVIDVYRKGEKKPLTFVEPSRRCATDLIETLELSPSFRGARYYRKHESHTYQETEAMRARHREIDAAAAPIFAKLDEFRDRIDATEEWNKDKDLSSRVSCEDYVQEYLEWSKYCKSIRTFDENDPPLRYDSGVSESTP